MDVSKLGVMRLTTPFPFMINHQLRIDYIPEAKDQVSYLLPRVCQLFSYQLRMEGDLCES